MIKRAHHIADGNNPVRRLCFKESTEAMYALKKRGLLKQEEPIHIVLLACENTPL